MKNYTDLVGHFRWHKLIMKHCKQSAWDLAPMILQERKKSVMTLRELILNNPCWDVVN